MRLRFHFTSTLALSKGKVVEKLLKTKAELDGKIRALLTSDGALTADQKTEHEKLKAELADVKARIATLRELDAQAAIEKADAEKEAEKVALEAREADRLKRANAASGRLTDSDSAANGGTARKDADGRTVASFEDTDEKITFTVGTSADARRRQTYAELKRANTRELKTRGYVPRGEFKSFAELIREGLNSTGSAAFDGRMNKHFASLLDNRGNFLRPNAAIQGMSEGVGADGGYMVMPEFAAGIIDNVYSNALWGRTDNYTVNGNNMTFLANAETSRAAGSRAGGLRGYWVGEGGNITSSKPTTREVSLKLVKLGVVVYLTNELISDGGAALETYVARKAAEEFNFMIGDALINGTGAGQPLGVLNAPSLVSVGKEASQPGSTLQTENIEKMYARFLASDIADGIWYHNQDVLPQLNTMTLGIGAAGVPTYLPPGGVSAAPYGTLKGRPIEPTEFNATLGTQGDLILADLSDVLSISKGGIAQAVSMHIQFLTDQLAVRFTMRLNARPWANSPLTPYKGSNTQSSFVTLDTRA